MRWDGVEGQQPSTRLPRETDESEISRMFWQARQKASEAARTFGRSTGLPGTLWPAIKKCLASRVVGPLKRLACETTYLPLDRVVYKEVDRQPLDSLQASVPLRDRHGDIMLRGNFKL